MSINRNIFFQHFTPFLANTNFEEKLKYSSVEKTLIVFALWESWDPSHKNSVEHVKILY